MKKYLISFLFFLMVTSSILSEGFHPHTLVKTKDGYAPIKDIKINDWVISYNFKTKILEEAQITNIVKKHAETIIAIFSENTLILTNGDQKFYCPMLEKEHWISAKDLRVGDFILKNIKELTKIDSISELKLENDFYCLTVDKSHNYLVSTLDILVHNWVVVIPICEFVIGAGFEWFLSLGAVATAATTVALLNIADKNKIDISGIDHINTYEISKSFNKAFNDSKLIHLNDKDKKAHLFGVKQGRKHGFIGGPNDEDPETWWKRIQNAISQEKTKGLKEGQVKHIRRPQSTNPYFGDLIIRVIFHAGQLRLSSAFLERLQK